MSKLDALINDINKQFKERIAAVGIERVETQKISFSSPRLNYMLYGGLPRNRLIEFAGEEGSGKTTTALDVVANAQELFKQEYAAEIAELEAIEKPTKEEKTRLSYIKSRGVKQIVYADCENTLDEDWATTLGVDVDEMITLNPMSQTAEQIFEMLLQMIETDEVGLIVIDSLGVMLSAQAYEKSMEEKTYGGIAAALTLFSRKAELVCRKYNCTLIGINQVRENLSSPYGGLTTTGGKAWRHNTSVRLMFQKGSFVDEFGNEIKKSSESPSGNLVMINMLKTKVCKPDRRVGFYTLMYDTGIDVLADTIDLAIRYDIIHQAGAWFTFLNEDGEVLADSDDEAIKIHGKANIAPYLEDNADILQNIFDRVNALVI